MPVRLLNDLEREKLNQFPEEISDQTINIHFTLSLADLFLSREQRGDHQQLGFALQLTTLRYLGFCPEDLTQAPKNVVDYLARQLKLDPAILPFYGNRSHTRRDRLLKIQHFLGYRDMSEAEHTNLAAWLLERSLEHDAPLVLFTLALEKLKKDKLVRPGLTQVERLVASVREKAQQQTFTQLGPLLNEQTRAFLDTLLVKDSELRITRLEWLRQPSVSNTPAAIVSSIEKLNFLREKGVATWDLKVLTAQIPGRFGQAHRWPLIVWWYGTRFI